VQTTYEETLREKPLIAAHRAFLNLAYETRNHWMFDATLNLQGSKRIPFTASNPEKFQLDERSPAFLVVNAQISKSWRNKMFEVYLGAENLLNYMQMMPIMAAKMPFSAYFDSTLVWGPVFGRNTYVGLRYKIK
jgi:outer membrane receptor for ferrienterochelin and colicins